MNAGARGFLLILLVTGVAGCAGTQQYHGELYFEQIVGHKVATDQERADSQACAKDAGLGQATHVMFSGIAMGLSERSAMKSCLRERGYEVN